MEIVSSGIVTVPVGISSAGLYVIQEGVLEILSNGRAQEIGVADGGRAVVSGGGILYVCTVSSGGTATVLKSGYAQDITAENGGIYLVSSGGTANRSILQSGGTMTVYADAMAAATSVMSGGVLHASSGAYVRGTVVSPGGVLQAWSSAVINGAEVSGATRVNSKAVVNTASVLDGGVLAVLSGGQAYEAKVSSGGSLDISPGGRINSARVYDGGAALVSAGASSFNAEINGGTITLAGRESASVPGASASNTTVNSGGRLHVSSGALAIKNTVNSGGCLILYSGASASNATVNAGGGIVVSSGAAATGVRENGGYVDVANGAEVSFTPNSFSGLEVARATVHSGTTAFSTTVGSGGHMEVFSGGITDAATIHAGGSMYVSSGGIATGQMAFESGAVVSAEAGAILDFDISELTPEARARVNDLAAVHGTPVYTLTVSAEQTKGVYTLAEGAAEFNGTITVQSTSGDEIGTLAAGETLSVGDVNYTLDLNGASLAVMIEKGQNLDNLVGTKDRVSWDPIGSAAYLVEYSTDDFAHGLRAKASKSAVDMLDMPAGTYQWRVRPAESRRWTNGDGFESDNTPGPAKALRSNADGCGDLFFASPDGTWEDCSYALHMGSVNDWTGTRELVSAAGKGRIRNFFFGSADPNVLCLTDADNGDAIFVDDVYTELPEGVGENTSRLYMIREIRAGAGDDIVDMTSQQFEYVGDGMVIRGGDGDDTVWANKGDNKLFGDAGNDRIVGSSGNDVIAGGIGNDRMHGGGGDDTFTFCENWGTDTVKQLPDGSVTLWFLTGSESNWDESTLTYTDGDSNVSVSGVAADRITLKFGMGDTAEDMNRALSLASDGAFLGFSSEKIFEESGRGILAAL